MTGLCLVAFLVIRRENLRFHFVSLYRNLDNAENSVNGIDCLVCQPRYGQLWQRRQENDQFFQRAQCIGKRAQCIGKHAQCIGKHAQCIRKHTQFHRFADSIRQHGDLSTRYP